MVTAQCQYRELCGLYSLCAAWLTPSVHAERVLQHRKVHKPCQLTFYYAALPSSAQGASAAQQLETACIEELRDVHCVPLLSVHDARAPPRQVTA